MKTINENQTLRNFEAWSGAKETKETILDAGMEADFENLIEELFPNGLTETELNDLLWFESDYIFETLGIKENNETELLT